MISGYEDWLPGEVADQLSGDSIPVGDVEGLHGAVIVLARRVDDQLRMIRKLQRRVSELERIRMENLGTEP